MVGWALAYMSPDHTMTALYITSVSPRHVFLVSHRFHLRNTTSTHTQAVLYIAVCSDVLNLVGLASNLPSTAAVAAADAAAAATPLLLPPPPPSHTMTAVSVCLLVKLINKENQ